MKQFSFKHADIFEDVVVIMDNLYRAVVFNSTDFLDQRVVSIPIPNGHIAFFVSISRSKDSMCVITNAIMTVSELCPSITRISALIVDISPNQSYGKFETVNVPTTIALVESITRDRLNGWQLACETASGDRQVWSISRTGGIERVLGRVIETSSGLGVLPNELGKTIAVNTNDIRPVDAVHRVISRELGEMFARYNANEVSVFDDRGSKLYMFYMPFDPFDLAESAVLIERTLLVVKADLSILSVDPE